VLKKRREIVSVVTLGCSKNTVDSERLLKQLSANDFKIKEDTFNADTVIINTCGFIQDAKEESINAILSAVELKKQGKVKKVIVTGCLAERYLKELKAEIPEADAFFGTEKYKDILKTAGGELKKELLGERIITTKGHSAYLKISEGCNHSCSFCAIPLIRGGHVTRPVKQLVKEAEFLAANKTKELVLIAQDTTSYGIDLYGRRNLADLLNSLSRIDGIEWIRLMYAYPNNFPDDVMDVIAENPKILNYLDIPLQHISDRVLKSMRRGITGKAIRKLLDKIRNRIDNVIIRTTFITGYPNETKEDFEELCRFIEEEKFERAGVFTFSQEENTSSYILGDPVPEDEKADRKNILMEIQKDISLEKNKNLINKELKILIERKEGEFYVGRSYRDAPEVDGEVLVPIDNGVLRLGNFYNVVVNDYDEYDLYGFLRR
jgi:ribosomal protein S12 methylthiotransferase